MVDAPICVAAVSAGSFKDTSGTRLLMALLHATASVPHFTTQLPHITFTDGERRNSYMVHTLSNQLLLSTARNAS